MGIIRSRKERLAEEAEHPGLSKYKIFWKDSFGKKTTVEFFWAKDDAAAKTELDIFLRKNQLVDPDDRRTYFYGSVGGIICDRGNGMEEEFDDFGESMRERESVWEKVRMFFMPAVWKLRDVRYAFSDFWFWLRHYDMKTNRSHQRYESWNLDSAVLDMLEFNIPIIIRDKNGVPNDFCVKARSKLHEEDPNFNVNASFMANPNPNEREMKLAEKLWNEELESVLLHIRLYKYYSSYGSVSDEDGPEYAEIDRKYGGTIPYKEGMDSRLDYKKIGEMTQAEWNWVWDWWKNFGQSCWT